MIFNANKNSKLEPTDFFGLSRKLLLFFVTIDHGTTVVRAFAL